MLRGDKYLKGKEISVRNSISAHLGINMRNDLRITCAIAPPKGGKKDCALCSRAHLSIPPLGLAQGVQVIGKNPGESIQENGFASFLDRKTGPVGSIGRDERISWP